MADERIASQAYLEVAAAHGVEYVFGLPGTSGQEFIGTIADQEKIRFILAMHETCVVSMADGHARVTGGLSSRRSAPCRVRRIPLARFTTPIAIARR
jgi:glyoxylate carboligase